MRELFLALLLGACDSDVPMPMPGPPATIQLGYLSERHDPGEQARLSLQIDTGPAPLGGYAVLLTYNPAVVSPVAWGPGDSAEFGTGIAAQLEAPGRLRLSGTNAVFRKAPVGLSQVATVDFLVTGKAGDYTSLALTVLSLVDTAQAPIARTDADTHDTGLLVGGTGGAGFLVAENKAWDDAKAEFEKKQKDWQPLIDQINGKLKEFQAARGNEKMREQLWKDIGDLVDQLNKRVAPCVAGLKKLVSMDEILSGLIKGLEQFQVGVSPWLSCGILGDTDRDKKKIRLNLKALADAVTFFSTLFHEGTHAGNGAPMHKAQDRSYFAEELCTEDRENRFRGFIGATQDARRAGQEWNYTLTWKAENGLLKKSDPGKYEVTDKGKKIADCYSRRLKDAGWSWDGTPSDTALLMYYNMEKWKTEKTRHKDDTGWEFQVITDATSLPASGQGGYDAKNPCD